MITQQVLICPLAINPLVRAGLGRKKHLLAIMTNFTNDSSMWCPGLKKERVSGMGTTFQLYFSNRGVCDVDKSLELLVFIEASDPEIFVIFSVCLQL